MNDVDDVPGNTKSLTRLGWLPVGFVYIQLQGKREPGDMYSGTWTNISSQFAGSFFRAAGGSASAFGSGQQASDNDAHTHGVTLDSKSIGHGHTGGMTLDGHHTHNYTDRRMSGAAECDATNEGTVADYPPRDHYEYSTDDLVGHTHTFTATSVTPPAHNHALSTGLQGSAEATPYNEAIRIWERTL